MKTILESDRIRTLTLTISKLSAVQQLPVDKACSHIHNILLNSNNPGSVIMSRAQKVRSLAQGRMATA